MHSAGTKRSRKRGSTHSVLPRTPPRGYARHTFAVLDDAPTAKIARRTLGERSEQASADAVVITSTLAAEPHSALSAAATADLMDRYRHMVLIADVLAGLGAGLLAVVLRFRDELSWPYLLLTVLVPLLWVLAVAGQRGYEKRFLGTGPAEFRRIGDAALALFVVAAVTSFLIKGELSRAYVMVVVPVVMLASMAARWGLRRWLFRQRLKGRGQQRVLIVGRRDQVLHLVEQFEREPWHGLRTVAVGITQMGTESHVDEPDWGVRLPYSGDPDTLVQQVDALRVDVVAVASEPDLSGHVLRRLGWALEERGVDLIVSPGIVEVAGPRLSIRPVAGLSLLHLDRPSGRGGRMVFKQVMDRMAAVSLLILASPLVVAIAVLIRLSSPGPVFFKQTRVGQDGRPFEMIKFRSMVVDAEARLVTLAELNDGAGPLFKMRDDPRVTKVGAFLRRFSLDELPQLWNVARGEMSLVGPRPPLPAEVAQYDGDATRRLRVRPGMTGLWQVSGRSDLSWEESLRLDLRYVDNWSIWLDLAIAWRTTRAVLDRRGAY